MCMLSYFKPGCIPNDEHLWNGADNNPDGHGWAIVYRDHGESRIMTNKSMSADAAIEGFMDARLAHPDGPAMFHSRIATGGMVNITGCHPFKVGNDPRTVVGHNGILFRVTGHESDTKIFADSILPRYGNLDKQKKRQKLTRFIGWSNKLVILTVNPARRQNAYIINESQGVWFGGEWHSNRDFEYSYKKISTGKYSDVVSSGYFPQNDDCLAVSCEVCFSFNTVDRLTLVCRICRCCNDCLCALEDCACFYPSEEKSLREKITATAVESYEAKQASVRQYGESYDHKTDTVTAGGLTVPFKSAADSATVFTEHLRQQDHERKVVTFPGQRLALPAGNSSE